jgi:sortase A
MSKNIHKHKKNKEYYRILMLRTVGNFLILSALFMIGKTFYQPAREELRYLATNFLNKKYVLAGTKESNQSGAEVAKGGLSDLLSLNHVEILQPQDTQYSIVIPKIGANSRIIPNVNAGNEDEYLAALKVGVAQALGTANPGDNGNIFLFAHSADNIFDVGTYNAVFYLLYKLEKGDEVNVFYKNKRYVYKVTDKKIVDPTEVEYLTRKTDSELLTLQTCYPPGTTLKRLLVFAVPANEAGK